MELENKIIKLYNTVQSPIKAKKIVTLLKLVLVDGVTDIDKIEESVPITLDTLRKYVNDKETLAKYLNDEELNMFLNKLGKLPKIFNRKLQKLIKLVMVDGETDIYKIQKTIFITVPTMKKYANNKNELLNYLTDNEIIIFSKKVNDMVELSEKSVEIENLKLVRNIIDDIFHTRYKLTDICSKNFMQRKTFEEYLNRENYIDSNFGEGTLEMVKAKISENGFARTKVPRDCFIIEDRISIYIARDELLYLNQYDNKKLNFAATYLGSGANLEFVCKKYETNDVVALSILFDKKLKQILKPEHYETLQRYIKIERFLIENNLEEKKNIVFGIINFLELNSFDKELALLYFNLPECLFNKILNEAIKMPYFNDEIKAELINMLNSEESKKVK